MRFITLSFFLLFFPQVIWAQVNTESFRKDGNQDGREMLTSSDIAYEAGNVRTLRGKQTLRINIDKGKWYTFLMGSFERGIQNKNVYLNRGFVHYRLVYHKSQYVNPESFVQQEFDEFLLMKNRFLVGLGNRFNFFDPQIVEEKRILSLGIGFMYEYENINSVVPQTTYIVRNTNYLTAKTNVGEQTYLSGTVYLQTNIVNINDYRVLGQISMTINVNKNFSIATNFNYRYDNEAPEELYPLDARVSNSFIVKF